MSEPSVPTKDEIAQLPRWARVAYAARCARRVLPLFQHAWAEAPTEYVKAIETAVNLAELAAASASPAAEHLASSVSAAAASASNASVAASAASAAAVAYDAVCASAAPAASIASFAARAAEHSAAAVNIPATAAIRADLDLLVKAANAYEWDDATPVPPEVFGSLWPDGPPEEWPTQEPPPAASANQTIPTKAEIAHLPRWARVAFVARCARRVLPLFKAGWRDAPQEYTAAVEHAVRVAEVTAGRTDAHHSADTTIVAADAADGAVVAAVAAEARAHSADSTEDADEAAYAAHTTFFASARSARLASNAAAYAAAAADATDAARADLVAGAVSAVSRDTSPRAIRLDFNTLRNTARDDHWDDRTPVTPTVFGPLWPDGPPPGWPEERIGEGDRSGPNTSYDQGPTPDCVSPPAVVVVWNPRVVSADRYAAFVAALNRLVKAEGGAGLKRLENRPFKASVPQGVPV